MENTEKKPQRPKQYRLAKKGQRGLTLVGFPFEITNELLQGSHADKVVTAIANWEAEVPGRKVLGRDIVLD